MKSLNISFIIATKDRPREIRRLFHSLQAQSRRPDKLIVVDGGTPPLDSTQLSEAGIPFRYIRHLPPSAAAQRNAGLSLLDASADLIGFVDDDVVFEPDAVEAMMDFWRSAPSDVSGASFNLVNHPLVAMSVLKRSSFAEMLGLYSRRPGRVTRSGFQTMIGTVATTTYVDWLPTTAALWRRGVFDRFRFDEWFRGYSYLEDLDFSHTVGREGRLAVVAGARFYHLQAPAGRGNDFLFGRREVKARLHFVGKHSELSKTACATALVIRLVLSASASVATRRPALLLRVLGNLVGAVEAFFGHNWI